GKRIGTDDGPGYGQTRDPSTMGVVFSGRVVMSEYERSNRRSASRANLSEACQQIAHFTTKTNNYHRAPAASARGLTLKSGVAISVTPTGGRTKPEHLSRLKGRTNV